MHSIFDIFRRKKEGGVWLIAGLGNPGAAYEATRHNVGFRAVDEIARGLSAEIRKKNFGALTGEAFLDGVKLVLIKPQTFMNLSGEAVQKALRFFKAEPEKLIVIYDDVDLPLGNIRLRAFGGTGSHNGMRSIADHIGDDAKFPRIRIGIGQQPKGVELRDYVLQKFRQEEAGAAAAAVSAAAAAALDVVRIGIERAMTAHNPKRK